MTEVAEVSEHQLGMDYAWDAFLQARDNDEHERAEGHLRLCKCMEEMTEDEYADAFYCGEQDCHCHT